MTPDILDWYYSRNYELMPSQPQHPKMGVAGWRNTQFVRGQVELAAQTGRGVLVKLGRFDVVIDVDLYHGPAVLQAYQRLCGDFGVRDLSELAPTVHTPRGGRHYYFRLPAGYDIRGHLDEYGEHVEFLTIGRHVNAAGSIHDTVAGAVYSFDLASPLSSFAPMLPLSIARKLQIVRPKDAEQHCPHWDSELLNDALSSLPVVAYANHTDWYKIFCASHFATGGSSEGKSVFLDWCAGDPTYADAGSLRHISVRWDSLTVTDKELYITHNTLTDEIRARIGYLPPEVSNGIERIKWAGADTPSIIYAAPKEVQPARRPEVPCQAPPVAAPSQVAPAVGSPPPPTMGSPDEIINRLNLLCDTLTEVSPTAEIESALALLGKLDSLQMARFAKKISGRTGVPVPEVKKRAIAIAKQNYAAIKDLGRRARIENAENLADGGEDDQDPVPTDLGQYLAEIVLQESYADGQRLVYTPEGQYWYYTGTHWEKRSEEGVKGDIHSAAIRLRGELSAASEVSVSALMHQTAQIMRAMCAKTGEYYFSDTDPKAVINCTNGELWLDDKTGTPEFRQHSPKSGLKNCLSIPYDPYATCPKWLDAIVEMFRPMRDPVGVAAHLMEVIGYTIQPRKNLASWVLLHGGGNNGKSTVLDVLTALLGVGSLSIPLHEVVTKNHTMAAIAFKLAVIEDDLAKGVKLPDGVLKKLSENKMLDADPKHRETFRFMNTATVWVASNHWPKTSDLSEGMKRRPFVFEFRRNFEREGVVNRNLKQEIIGHELPGVLNVALAGLMSVRRKGDLVRPSDCERSRMSWLDGSNQLRRFLADRTESDPTAVVRLSNLFELYSLWCDTEGIKRSFSRSGFSAELLTAGYVKTRKDNADLIHGIRPVQNF